MEEGKEGGRVRSLHACILMDYRSLASATSPYIHSQVARLVRTWPIPGVRDSRVLVGGGFDPLCRRIHWACTSAVDTVIVYGFSLRLEEGHTTAAACCVRVFRV